MEKVLACLTCDELGDLDHRNFMNTVKGEDELVEEIKALSC